MQTFTKEEIERLRALRWIKNHSDEELKKLPVKFEDVRLLVRRIEDLDLDEYHGADEIVRFTLARLEEDLTASKENLKDQIETTRIAELQVKESTRALAAVKALLAGDMYASGEEVNIRWDEIETEFRMQGFLPEEEVIEAPKDEASPSPEPETPEPPPPDPEEPTPAAEHHPDPSPGTEKAPWGQKTRGRAEPIDQAAQEAAVLAALKVAAGDAEQVQVSLKIIGEAAGIAHGSVHAVLHRLADAGRIEIIKVPVEKGSPQPNIYRFAAVPKAEEPPKAVEPTPAPQEPEPAPDEPVVIEQAAEKLADAWGAKVKKPSGLVPQAIALRDRIVQTLRKAACTTSGLASMLDVKELAVCQTLTSMQHEGAVQADEMPEGGRRSQLWRLAEAPTPAA